MYAKYDLEKSLCQHPIKELADEEDKQRLLESLQRENLQYVTLQVNCREDKVAVEAAAQFKSVNFYDGQEVRTRPEKEYQGNTASQAAKERTKKESEKQSEDDEGAGFRKGSRRKKADD